MADIHNLPVAKACSNCARAKAKCNPASGGQCSRCTRLGKDCIPQQAVRKRKAPRIRRSEQIAQLQDTVNGLLSIVGAGQQLPREQAAAFLPSPASIASSNHSEKLPVTLTLVGKVPGTHGGVSTIGESVPFLNNSHILLSIFRDRLAAQFPFVAIPSQMKADDLHRDKPMVYMAVMLAASYADTNTQQELRKLMLKYLATNVILEGKKSLDILQGLLLYICLNHYLCHVNNQTNNLLGLLSAQLVDLGIKRVPAESEVHESFMQIARRVQTHTAMPDCVQRNCGRTLTMDEKRSFLGCYYLSSCLSSSSSRLDCLRFPPYIKECCDDLTEAVEYPTDIKLTYLARLQSLVEKQRVGGLWESVNSSKHEALRAPVGFLVRSYQLELQEFKASLPAGYLSDPLFSMNYYVAEICLYEVGFKLSSTTGVAHDIESLRLTDILYSCFQATRSWFEAYLSIPVAEYCTLSLINFGQFFHAIGALYKLSVFDIPEWDIAVVRETLDLSNLLGQFALRLDEAGELYSGQVGGQNSPWTYCAAKLRNCKNWWDMTVVQETDTPAEGEEWPEGSNEELLPFMDFDYLDEYFWQAPEAMT